MVSGTPGRADCPGERSTGAATAAPRRGRAPRIAREGWPFVGVPLLLGLGALAAGWTFVAVPLLVLAGFCAWFFRDPDRPVPRDPSVVVSPADGRIVEVERLPDGRLRLAIFLSIFDVHVNRSPVAGRVRRVTHTPGRFLAAWRAETRDVNERNEVVLETGRGPVHVLQVAGLIARRIVCRVAPGTPLGMGERFGMIRFGSRTEVILPPGAVPEVRVGDTVRGGASVVARWEDPAP